MHEKECIFLNTIADRNKTYKYSPRWFRFKNGTKYMPDFYCFEDNTYIEIVGTRQAFHKGKDKYNLLIQEYPNANILFVFMHKLNSISTNKIPIWPKILKKRVSKKRRKLDFAKTRYKISAKWKQWKKVEIRLHLLEYKTGEIKHFRRLYNRCYY